MHEAEWLVRWHCLPNIKLRPTSFHIIKVFKYQSKHAALGWIRFDKCNKSFKQVNRSRIPLQLAILWASWQLSLSCFLILALISQKVLGIWTYYLSQYFVDLALTLHLLPLKITCISSICQLSHLPRFVLRSLNIPWLYSILSLFYWHCFWLTKVII